MTDKSSLRARCRALREAMTPEQVAFASARICDHLAAWPAFQQAQVVMIYMAFGKEINLMPLVERFPARRWVVPRTLAKPEPHLILHPYDPTRLVRHRFGMLEPDPHLPTVESGELEVVLAPGLVYDRRGYRLGYGGGYYDRLLARVAAIKVGIAYAALMMDRIPNDEFDQPVDWLASEVGICQSI